MKETQNPFHFTSVYFTSTVFVLVANNMFFPALMIIADKLNAQLMITLMIIALESGFLFCGAIFFAFGETDIEAFNEKGKANGKI